MQAKVADDSIGTCRHTGDIFKTVGRMKVHGLLIGPLDNFRAHRSFDLMGKLALAVISVIHKAAARSRYTPSVRPYPATS